MIKLGVGALYENLGRVQIWGSQPPGCTTPKCGVGKISADCLVAVLYLVCADAVD